MMSYDNKLSKVLMVFKSFNVDGGRRDLKRFNAEFSMLGQMEKL